jgi:hypothetical protein
LPNTDLSSPALQLKVDQITQRYAEIYIACDRYKTGQLTLDAFLDFIKLWGHSLYREKPRELMIEDDIEELDSDANVELEIEPNYRHFWAGLEVIFPIQEDEDVEHHAERIDRGLRIMQEGNRDLLGLKPAEVTQITQDTVKDISCIACGTDNAPGELLCKDCGAKLPRQEANTAELAHKPLTGRLDKFRSACMDVMTAKDKKSALEKFEHFLATMEAALKAKREKFEGELGGYGEHAMDEVEMATQGMDDYEAGIEELWVYFEGNGADSAVMQRGLQLISAGNEKINKAMAMNRSNRKELADEFGYV